jgi:glc operon protein GlcG
MFRPAWKGAQMTNRIIAAAFFSFLQASVAFVQPAFAERNQLTSDAARIIVETCLAFAAVNDMIIGVAVVDRAGVVLAFQLMEGRGPTASETAILKARTAAHWGRPTQELEDWVRGGGNRAPLWIEDFPQGGGLPIIVDGQVAGAVGVGGPGRQDECAQAGIDAAFGEN